MSLEAAKAAMIVHRTLKLKLDLDEEQEAILFRTMELYSRAFEISAQWGFRNRNSNKIDNHKATYRVVRESYPELQSYLVESARDLACEALKQFGFKHLPETQHRPGQAQGSLPPRRVSSEV